MELGLRADRIGPGSTTLTNSFFKKTNLPRNLAPDFPHYTGKRPDVIPHDEESLKVRTIKRKWIRNKTYENEIG